MRHPGWRSCARQTATKEARSGSPYMRLTGVRQAAAAVAAALMLLCAAPAGAQSLGELAAFSHVDGCATALEFERGKPTRRPVAPGCRAMTRQFDVSSLAMAPDGSRLYSVAASSESVVAYRTLETGGLRELTGEGSCLPLAGAHANCRLAQDVEDRHGGASAISPDGRHLYVASVVGPQFDEPNRPATAVIDVLRVSDGLARVGCLSSDGTDGHGAAVCARMRGVTTPVKMIASRDGRSLYALSTRNFRGPSYAPSDPGIAVFARDPDSGALSQPDGTAACTTHAGSGGECAVEPAFDGLNDLVLSPSGAAAYATAYGTQSGGVLALRRYPATGTLEPARGPGTCFGAPAGRADCTADDELTRPETASVSPDGRYLYVGTDLGMHLLETDEATPSMTRRACISDGYPKSCIRVTSDPSVGRMVFGRDARTALLQTSDVIESLAHDPATGSVSTRGCIAAEETQGCSTPAISLPLESLSIAPGGKVAYAGEGPTIYTLAPGAAVKPPATVRVRSGGVSLPVRCDAPTRCTGTLTLASFNDELRAPPARLSIPPGTTRTVRVPIPASVRRAIERRRRVTFDATTRIALGGRQGLLSEREIRIDAARPLSRPTCRRGGVRTLVRTARMRVYTVRVSEPGFQPEEKTFACLFAAGRQVPLDDEEYHDAYGPFRLAGSLLAYDYELEADGESDAASFIRVLDLRSGRERRQVCAGGPKSCAFESSDVSVHSIVLLRSGGVAWTASDGGEHFVFKADAGGEERELDSAYGRIRLGSLRLSGGRVTWKRGDATRSATLR